VSGPEGWKLDLAKTVQIPPGERVPLPLTIEAAVAAEGAAVRIQGAFGPAGKPILSLRFATEPRKL
jgi:hypothetical protein